ncbi:MAG: protein translocase subunit SecF [Candidatus Colwellbacteria bacterium CG10_big_fil_rev_8_21_14_0_10_42_22]|uniref:Protein-export membrane protein SecF n=1 Tax=Candidatus Colwellbacteria bacterium CG10_big_fil_rev_8_21_14_0_10_42_22 TaxID=1974540 RepID=A0A2H0VID5_9BACT|nr:MAG: protein translocase subunit SecF [Candidatus Colwellbacteria bacterium CG10_big_fil_rev_8_21_14_0_10_42_22]
MKKLLKYKKVFLGFSLILTLISAAAVAYFGFKPGIDFTSGSLWQVIIPETSVDELKGFLADGLGLNEVNISSEEGQIYTLTMREISDGERQEMLTALKLRFGESTQEQDFWSVSPTVSKELRTKAWWAIGLVLLSISLYIAFAFRKVSDPVSSWKYGLITLITLSHDVLLPAGLFALLGAYKGVTVDTNFMVALLVVMGFSVHDTIVVFDRIRENLVKWEKRFDLEELIDRSIAETIARSINTSITLIFVLVAIYVWGPLNLKFFILAILVGTIAGTYSSIFIASPLLLLAGKEKRK